jgi:hypothetical protein
MNPDSLLGKSNCPFFAMSQLYSAVRAPPTCNDPVGDGANRKRGGSLSGDFPANGKVILLILVVVVGASFSAVEDKRTVLDLMDANDKDDVMVEEAE